MSLPRLLSGVTGAPMTLAQHHRHHGQLPPAPGLAAEIAAAGLRGRGGSAFPLSVKLDAVRRSRRTPLLVVNGCEGEPMSAKDRLLLCSLPHLVLDGAFATAQAIGADEIVMAVDGTNVRALDTLQWALAERPELARDRMRAEVVAVPGGYVTGQESAIVRWCNEGLAAPTTASPRVTERGIGRRPTLVSNAETLAHVALIARHGARWFRELGTGDDPGSALVTISGGVARPGVYEVAHGSSLGSLVGAAGGLTEPARAFLIGGYAGTWIDSGQARGVRLSPARLRPAGVRLGPGIVVVLPRRSCPVAEVARVAGWLADHSAGQCGPCVNGLAAIADELAAVCDGSAGADTMALLSRWCAQVVGRGACAHPDGAANFVASAVQVFAAEFADHAEHGLCDACESSPILATPGQPAVAAR